MATSFDSKCLILAQIWMAMRDEDDSPFNQEVLKVAENEFQLAYYYAADLIAEFTELALEAIERTWSLVCEIFELDIEHTYYSLEDIMEWKEDQENFGEEEETS